MVRVGRVPHEGLTVWFATIAVPAQKSHSAVAADQDRITALHYSSSVVELAIPR